MAKKEEKSKQSSQAKKGLLLTTTIAAAAGLVGAALLYLRRRGIEPGREAKRIGGKAKTASTLLRGESKQAYQEVRAVIVQQLVESEKPLSRRQVETTIRAVITMLRRRGENTSTELAALAKDLMKEWRTLIAETKRSKGA